MLHTHTLAGERRRAINLYVRDDDDGVCMCDSVTVDCAYWRCWLANGGEISGDQHWDKSVFGVFSRRSVANLQIVLALVELESVFFTQSLWFLCECVCDLYHSIGL